jgi:hypothetical protein
MNDKTAEIAKHSATPKLSALELASFAEGVQMLAEQIEGGFAHSPTKEQLVDAEQAALALLRNAPLAVRAIRRLEGYAEDIVNSAATRRDEIMTAMWGPDTE